MISEDGTQNGGQNHPETESLSVRMESRRRTEASCTEVLAMRMEPKMKDSSILERIIDVNY